METWIVALLNSLLSRRHLKTGLLEDALFWIAAVSGKGDHVDMITNSQRLVPRLKAALKFLKTVLKQ